MVLVGAAVLPHGALIFDGDPGSHSPQCRQRYEALPPDMKASTTRLYQGCMEVAEMINKASPDVIVLDTPHGLSLSDAVAIYTNSTASGNASWNQQWQEFSIEVNCDETLSGQLIDQLRRGGIPTEGLLSYANQNAILRWGEVIPVWFIQQALKSKEVKYIFMSTPRKPAMEYIDTSCDIGHRLAMMLHSLPEKVVMVISGDLSHVYPTKCQDHLYLPNPQSFLFTADSNATAASSFEAAIKNWVGCNKWIPKEAYHHLEEATSLQSSALSCGIKGFQLLHGALRHVISSGSEITSHLVTCEAPTYYGMLTAFFKIDKKAETHPKPKSPR